MIYLLLFGVGHIILGRPELGSILAVLGLGTGALIYRRLNAKGWKSFSS
jgi:hypothetical protein